MSHAWGWWAPLGLCVILSAGAEAEDVRRNVPEFIAGGDDVRDALLVLAEDVCGSAGGVCARRETLTWNGLWPRHNHNLRLRPR